MSKYLFNLASYILTRYVQMNEYIPLWELRKHFSLKSCLFKRDCAVYVITRDFMSDSAAFLPDMTTVWAATLNYLSNNNPIWFTSKTEEMFDDILDALKEGKGYFSAPPELISANLNELWLSLLEDRKFRRRMTILPMKFEDSEKLGICSADCCECGEIPVLDEKSAFKYMNILFEHRIEGQMGVLAFRFPDPLEGNWPSLFVIENENLLIYAFNELWCRAGRCQEVAPSKEGLLRGKPDKLLNAKIGLQTMLSGQPVGIDMGGLPNPFWPITVRVGEYAFDGFESIDGMTWALFYAGAPDWFVDRTLPSIMMFKRFE